MTTKTQGIQDWAHACELNAHAQEWDFWPLTPEEREGYRLEFRQADRDEATHEKALAECREDEAEWIHPCLRFSRAH